MPDDVHTDDELRNDARAENQPPTAEHPAPIPGPAPGETGSSPTPGPDTLTDPVTGEVSDKVSDGVYRPRGLDAEPAPPADAGDAAQPPQGDAEGVQDHEHDVAGAGVDTAQVNEQDVGQAGVQQPEASPIAEPAPAPISARPAASVGDALARPDLLDHDDELMAATAPHPDHAPVTMGLFRRLLERLHAAA